jgi:hypothetical protein
MKLISDHWLPKVERGEFKPSAAQLKSWRAKVGTYDTDTTRLLDVATEEHNWRVAKLAGGEWNIGWLMSYRVGLRRVIEKPDIARILLFLAECPREMRPLGVWLLGQCADRNRLHNLRYFCGDPSPKVRKHVARALRRNSAWHLLAAMARAFPNDPIVRQIHSKANEPITKRPFAARLKSYTRNVDDSHAAEAVGSSRMPYWSRYTPWQGRPAKSLEFIRSILLHIRRLLRGNGTAH